MKKTKFLALVLVVAIALMGAGYASWTDYFTVVGTAKTGNLDMQIVSANIYDGNNLGELQRAWTEATIDSINKDSLVITAKDLYPGADIRLDFLTKNMGTAPCDFDSVTVEFIDGDWNLYNALSARGHILYDTDGTGTDYTQVGRAWGYVPNNKLTNLNANLQTVLSDMILHPGGTLAFDPTDEGCIRFGLPYEVDNSYQNKWCTFRLTFNFGQPNPAHGLQAPNANTAQ